MYREEGINSVDDETMPALKKKISQVFPLPILFLKVGSVLAATRQALAFKGQKKKRIDTPSGGANCTQKLLQGSR